MGLNDERVGSARRIGASRKAGWIATAVLSLAVIGVLGVWVTLAQRESDEDWAYNLGLAVARTDPPPFATSAGETPIDGCVRALMGMTPARERSFDPMGESEQEKLNSRHFVDGCVDGWIEVIGIPPDEDIYTP